MAEDDFEKAARELAERFELTAKMQEQNILDSMVSYVNPHRIDSIPSEPTECNRKEWRVEW